jgi:phosphoribosylanthranilate isomerase
MNTKIKLKVCGMRDWTNILEVANAKPDYMGFIFFPQSPRFVGVDFQLPNLFPSTINKVGVFVNSSTEEILKQAKRLKLDYLQLHGNELPEQCKELLAKKNKIIKVFSVGDDFDFTITKRYADVVDYFLFDTKGKYYGGNARTFDWAMLTKYDQRVPFFLSGGISSYNVSDIRKLEGMNIHAIDVNSGVEVSPGLKDVERVKDIMYEL